MRESYCTRDAAAGAGSRFKFLVLNQVDQRTRRRDVS